MTRKIAKSVKFSAIVALLVLMVLGIDEVFADNQAQVDLYEFHELLEGVSSEIVSTQGQIQPVADTTQTIHDELIKHQKAILEAFDEVIQNNIF